MADNKKGILIDKKFLTGIIPEHWSEKIYEFDTYYACMVKGERDEKRFLKIIEDCKKEFGDSLIEVFSQTGHGVKFIVYLRKDK